MQRVLGLPTLLALGVNGVVGVGIFFAVPEVAKAVPGYLGLLVYAGVVLACLPIALVYGKLGARLNEDGGPYVFARAALGERAAYGIGWISYVSAVFSTATVVVGLVEATSPKLGFESRAQQALLAAILVTALSLLLSRGLRISAWAWTSITVAKLVPLGLLLAAAVVVGRMDIGEPVAPAATQDVTLLGVLGGGMAVLFSLQGFEVVPLPAGQVKNAQRAVPIATVFALVFAGLLYMALHLACLLALPDPASRAMPIADAAAIYGGPWLGELVVAGISISSFGITVGMLAMTPRYLAALSKELGPSLAASQNGAPRRAFAISWALVLVVTTASFLYGSIANLFALSSISVLLQYVVTAAALWVLSRRGERGFVPRDAWPVPLVFVASLYLVAGAEAIELVLVAVVVAAGFGLRAMLRGRAVGEVASP